MKSYHFQLISHHHSITSNGLTLKATTYHPVIQKEVDELLTMGSVTPLTGVAGFYSNVFYGS